MWKTIFDDEGKQVQYWSLRTPYDPENPDIKLPDPKLPIAENVLIFDENAGEQPRGGGGGRGRFYGKDSRSEQASRYLHSASNLAWGQGGWRKYKSNAPPDKSVPRTKVKWSNAARTPTSSVMGLAILGTGKVLAAWEYVNDLGVKTLNKGQDYEWYHLLGHGLGGADDVTNLVAGTHACNSEQLCIESWLRDKAARRIYCEVKIRAQIAKDGPPHHLAEGISYTVYRDGNGGGEIYHKWLDARRTVEPSRVEKRAVWDALDAAYG